MSRSGSTRRSVAALAFLAAAHAAPTIADAAPYWSRTLGGPTPGEFVHAVGEMGNGDIVVAASTDSFGTTTGDAWLIRLDAAGDLLSESVVGNPLAGGVDGAVVLPDGGAVFASRNVREIFLQHDALVVRVAADGSVTWATEITAGANPGRFFVNDLVAVSDGTFLGVGQAAESDAGPHLGWLVRLSATGGVLWQKYYGGFDMSFDAAVETADRGFVVTGWATGGAGQQDALVVKLDEAGDVTWTRRVGGAEADEGTGIVAIRGGGGYGVAGWTNSFTPSGHSAWVIRLDVVGAIAWTETLGLSEWGDLQAITQTADQNLLVLGRLSQATNDLYAAEIHQSTSTPLWQRTYAGVSGDMGADVMVLADGDFLMAGSWGWGFPEEDLWLLRTQDDGTIPGCGLVADAALTISPPRYTQSTPALTPALPFGNAITGTVTVGDSTLAAELQCAPVGCAELRCVSVAAAPDPACEGTSQTLSLVTTGGFGDVTVTWDLDGDTTPETLGNDLVRTFPVGTTTVTAFANDECEPTPADCSLPLSVTVLSAAPPGEVSDVRGGAVPLLVLDHGARVSFEDRADAVAYNLYADRIGSWYFPSAASGSQCFVTTTPGGPGRLETAPTLAVNTWLVVTASTPCAEGHAGTDSFGVNRMTVGTWAACGPAP